jgi:hypothetical protein
MQPIAKPVGKQHLRYSGTGTSLQHGMLLVKNAGGPVVFKGKKFVFQQMCQIPTRVSIQTFPTVKLIQHE